MGRMPFRGRLAAWANVLLPSAGAGLALLWVFAFRFSSLWRALLFALSMAGLLGYGLYLLQFRARPQGKQALREERRRAVQALARWETERALRAGFAALAQRHQLRCIGEGPGLLLAQYRGETVAVALLQALDQTGLPGTCRPSTAAGAGFGACCFAAVPFAPKPAPMRRRCSRP